MITTNAKVRQEVELDENEAKLVAVEFLCKKFLIPNKGKWSPYSIHEGMIGTWESCYHNSVEFNSLIKDPTEAQVHVAEVINAIHKE